MKTSLIVSILIIVGIVGVYMFMFRSKSDDLANTNKMISEESPTTGSPFVQQAPRTTPSVNTVTTVSITDEGFVPSEITVHVGDTVQFINNGQGTHWPASDPHPQHTGLAGFDAKAGLETGQSYEFTFMKAGAFKMHDHLHPLIKGNIIVE